MAAVFRRKRRTIRRPKKSIKMMVKRVVNSAIRKNTELKYYDYATTTSVDYAGTFYQLSAIAQGDTDVQRDGDKLTAKRCRIRGTVTTGDTTQVFRVICFRWKQNTLSVAPTQTYLLSPYTSSVQAAYCPMNHDTQANMQVLYDKTYVLNSVSKPQLLINISLNLSKLPKVSYDAGSTTNGNNQIYMYVVSDSAVATHPSINFISRLSFVDS